MSYGGPEDITTLVSVNSATPSVSIFNADALSFAPATYTVTLTASVVGHPTISASVTFEIETSDPCAAANNMRFVDPSNLQDVTLNFGDANSVTTWVDADIALAYNEPHSICGEISYSWTLSDGSPLDARVIEIDFATSTFTIKANDAAMIGTYLIEVRGWQGSQTAFAATKSFTVTVTSFCTIRTLTNPA